MPSHSVVMLDGSSGFSSTRTSNPLLVADAQVISVSWQTVAAVSSNLVVQGSNEEGQLVGGVPLANWSLVSTVASAGIFSVTPGMRWIRFVRPAADSQGSIVVNHGSLPFS